MSPNLQVVRRAGCWEIVLNRPQRRNALSAALLAELTATLEAAAAEPQAHSVILTGAPPAFCAGLDLREVGQVQGPFDNSALLKLLRTCEQSPCLVVAAVNGAALAGGAVLVCACDVALAAESATLGFPGLRRGLVAPVVMTSLLRTVGLRQARYLVLTGETITARRARELGLVHEVVPDADLLERARQLAAGARGVPAPSLRDTKRLFGELRGLTEPAHEALERIAALVHVSPAAQARLREFGPPDPA